jgi:predicted SprT family Zn-dependent metalloprotease
MKNNDLIRIAREELNNVRALNLSAEETTRLQRAYFELSNRMTSAAGLATVGGPNTGRIKLSVKIFTDPRNADTAEADLRNTVLHELAHIAAPRGSKHGPVWKRLAVKFGCTGEQFHEMAVTKRQRWDWDVTCPGCGHKVGVLRNRATVARWMGNRVSVCCRVPMVAKKVS